jgi:hypothetical protein
VAGGAQMCGLSDRSVFAESSLVDCTADRFNNGGTAVPAADGLPSKPTGITLTQEEPEHAFFKEVALGSELQYVKLFAGMGFLTVTKDLEGGLCSPKSKKESVTVRNKLYKIDFRNADCLRGRMHESGLCSPGEFASVAVAESAHWRDAWALLDKVLKTWDIHDWR